MLFAVFYIDTGAKSIPSALNYRVVGRKVIVSTAFFIVVERKVTTSTTFYIVTRVLDGWKTTFYIDFRAENTPVTAPKIRRDQHDDFARQLTLLNRCQRIHLTPPYTKSNKPAVIVGRG